MEKGTSIIALVVVLCLSLLPLSAHIQAVYGQTSPPWLGSWLYRKSHVIEAAVGSGTGYQVGIKAYYGSGVDGIEASMGKVYLNGHCRSDFGDIRFTRDDGTSLLDYWMESEVDGDYAIFWVEMDDDLSSGNRTIYIYYGKSDETTTSNGTSTFQFFDHFIGASLNPDNWDTVNSPSIFFSDTAVTISNPGEFNWRGIKSDNAFGPYSLAWRCYGKLAESKYNSVGLGGENANPDDEGANFFWLTDSREYVRSINNGVSTATNVEMGGNAGNWHLFEITWKSGENGFYVDGSSTATQSSNIPDSSTKVFAGVSLTTSLQMDWVLLRKWVSPEPTHVSWGEESLYPSPIRLSLKLSGGFDYSSRENVKVRLSALVKDASTEEAVSNANVSIRIYYPNSTLWVSDTMVEKISGTGIYEWESTETIFQMTLTEGVYLVHVEASVGGGPVASDMLLFHMDPPLEETTSITPLLFYMTTIVLLVAGTTMGIALLKRHRRSQVVPR